MKSQAQLSRTSTFQQGARCGAAQRTSRVRNCCLILLAVLPAMAAAQSSAQVERLRTLLTAKLLDPAAAQFRGQFAVEVEKGTVALCGEVNAKNRMGAYVGFRRFYAAGTASEIFTQIEGEPTSVYIDGRDLTPPADVHNRSIAQFPSMYAGACQGPNEKKAL